MKNKKVFLSIPFVFALFSHSVLADEQPHVVLAANCPLGQTCCPTAVYCSYKQGTCGNAYNWYVSGDLAQAYTGVQKFELFHISSFPIYNDLYQINCSYGYPGNTIELIDNGFKLNGNWQYSGWGDKTAYCPTRNPLDCTGTKS